MTAGNKGGHEKRRTCGTFPPVLARCNLWLYAYTTEPPSQMFINVGTKTSQTSRPLGKRSKNWVAHVNLRKINEGILKHNSFHKGGVTNSCKSETRSSDFWDFTQRICLIPYRRFGATNRSHFQVSNNLLRLLDTCKTGLISYPEASLWNYHSTWRKIPEARTAHAHRGWSLKSRISLREPR